MNLPILPALSSLAVFGFQFYVASFETNITNLPAVLLESP